MRPILPSFAGGEWSEDMYGRVDIDKYSIACKKLKNMVVNPTGSASNRPGTEYIAKVKDSSKRTRLIPFEYSTKQAYMLEFGDYYIRFCMNGGQIVKPSADSWVTRTSYTVGDYVTNSSKMYYCVTAHTSGTFTADLSSGHWTMQTIYEIPSPYSADDIFLIKYVQSADTMYLTHPDYHPRTLVRNGHSDWKLSQFDNLNGPFMIENTDDDVKVTPSGTTGTVTLTATDDIFDEGMVGSLMKLSFVTESGNLSGKGTTTGFSSISGTASSTGTTSTINCMGTWTLSLSTPKWGSVVMQKSTDSGVVWTDMQTYTTSGTYTGNTTTNVLYRLKITNVQSYTDGEGSTEIWSIKYSLSANQAILIPANDLTSISWRFVTHGTWAAKFHIQKSVDKGSTWKTLESYSGNSDYNASTSGTVDEACWMRVYMYEYTSGTMYYDFYVDSYRHNGVVKITEYTDTKHVTAKIITELLDASATPFWSKGSWSETNGFPRCAEFYQDRLCFASTTKEPETIWCSKTGDYPNFGVSTDVQDDDRISVTLVSRKVNQIENLVGYSQLIALTSSANWIVGPGSSSDAFTPSNKRGVVQGYRGSDAIQPASIENRIIYVQALNANVRDLGYSWESDGWTGKSVSITSNHLLEGYEIIEMAYQQNPGSVVWMVRSDGILLGLTYLDEQQVNAWHWHETNGTFESVATIPGDGYNEVWFVIKRNGTRYIERMKKRMASTETAGQFFLDCGLTYSGTAANAIAGLSHLEGRTVVALADGFVVKNLTVSNGKITLPFAAEVVHVGLPYVSDLEPLNFEIPLNNGTSQGLPRRIPKVMLRLKDTLGGWVGRDENHLTEIPFRSNEPMGQCVDLFTGDKEIPIESDFADSTIFIRQTDPLPITVLAVVMDLELGK